MKENNSNFKSFLMGTLVGSVIGAISALLLAPKSGKELRQNIADTTHDIRDKANDIVNDGKQKVKTIIDSVKCQTDSILKSSAEYFEDLKDQNFSPTDTVQKRFDNLKEAAKAGTEAFKNEINK